MTIPKDHEFFPKVMESVQDGKEHSIAEIKEYCVTNSNFTKEQLDQRYPKSGDFVLLDRIGWAIAELKAAGLLEIPNRGMYKITEIGKEILTKHPENLTRKYLHQYGKYKIFAENYIKNKDLLRNKFGVDLNQNLNLTEENGLNFADERKNMIPAYHKFYHKVMESVEDGKEHSIKEIKNYCATTSNFTEEEMDIRLMEALENQIPDWKFSYLRYIGMEMSPEDYLAFSTAYIDEDDIPEIVACGNSATGTYVLTFHNGQVNTQFMSGEYGVNYIEHEGSICNSTGRMDTYYDEVFSLKDGDFHAEGSGIWSVHYDENENETREYHWNDAPVTEEEYMAARDSCFDFSRSVTPYDETMDYYAMLDWLSPYE